ncbi:MAG: hypothetical protein HQ510_10320 [Candidatus Marinimicrobia bacterium]|nr:hypothetical protein [Candidatus Neomarinimicrobiota bacterium]
MKFAIILLCVALGFSQDIAGDYELNSIETIHTTHFVMSEGVDLGGDEGWSSSAYYNLIVFDIHGFYYNPVIDTVFANELLHERTIGPLEHDELVESGIFMDITFNENGTGNLTMSPLLNIFDCREYGHIFEPFNDGFQYTSDLETGVLTTSNYRTFGEIDEVVSYFDITGDGIPDSTAMISGFVNKPNDNTLILETHSVVTPYQCYYIDPCIESHDFTMHEVMVTNTNDSCNYNYPIYGDATGLIPDECIDSISVGREFYMMDTTFSFWNNLQTFNSVSFSFSGDSSYYVDDSGYDFNMATMDGRFIFDFSSTCIPQFEVRELRLEFTRVVVCSLPGDMNDDSEIDVTDIVIAVDCILDSPDSENCDCGDMNADEVLDVLDIVIQVGLILGIE